MWPYPGSRWWKFDFHTHTPKSQDTPWHRENLDLKPEQWLLRYMAAGIDCVAVTDHNSGAWIDWLKEAYTRMKAQAESGSPPENFRELAIFPGVEISVSGGFHLLAIFDPNASTSDIDSLWGRVDYRGTTGNSDGVTQLGPVEVAQAVLDSGAIPIPAHADRPEDKALLAVRTGTRECSLDANTVKSVLELEGLLAMEWEDLTRPFPSCVEKRATRLARVLGSDCHSFQGSAVPGSRYTWVKMTRPTLEGLRLALLDGNSISIRRSDEGTFDPFKKPAHFISSIEIEAARFMGNGQSERLEFTPYYNALIGGRGTGKSTIVHATRLVLRRDEEVKRLGDETEPRRQFERFSKRCKGREGEGALREKTEIRAELMIEGIQHRLRWRADGQGAVVEERTDDDSWQPSASQAIHAERFPVRIFSQGQIAAMAGDDRQALLAVIDEAGNVKPLHDAFGEVKRTYFAQRARLRELDGHLAGRLELERKLAELTRKLEAFAQSHHADVLKAHQQAQRQQREIDEAIEQLRAVPARIDTLAQDLLLDDWHEGSFDASNDGDVLAWRVEIERTLAETREALIRTGTFLREQTRRIEEDGRLGAWRERAEQARVTFDALQAALAEQGVTDPQAFKRLVQERQQLENQLKKLDHLLQDRDSLQTDNDAQWRRVQEARTAITVARADFVRRTLHDNEFVRMEVVNFGFDARAIERSLRELLDVTDDRFENDILRLNNGEPDTGLAQELAQATDRAQTLQTIKKRLIEIDARFGGHFHKFLQRKLEKPEFGDHIRCWFPEDDLHIKYSRSGDGHDWVGITQGSQGQRSATLLAFLLAFGDEPLILDQPEDDLDNHLIYDLIVRQIRENKLRRQLIIVTHNPNVVVNGDAEMVHAFDFRGGQCRVIQRGALQEKLLREEVCRVMEGGHEAFKCRWARLGQEV